MSKDYNYLFKIIVVGDKRSGKKTLVTNFSYGYFPEQNMLTLGIEFAIKSVAIENDVIAKLQIWEIASQERFQYVRPLYYRGAMGAIVIFDLTNRESFNRIPKWLEEIKTNAGDIPVLMIGNKADLSYKITVSRDETQTFAEKYGIKYLEGSAMNGSGLGDPFGVLSCLLTGISIPVKFLKDTFILEPKSKIELTIDEAQKILGMDPIQFSIFLTELKNQIPSILGDEEYVWSEGKWICEKCGKENPISQDICVECHEKSKILTNNFFKPFL